MNGHDLIDLGAHRVWHAAGARAIRASGGVDAGHVAEGLVDPFAADAAVGFLCEDSGTDLPPPVPIGLARVAHPSLASLCSPGLPVWARSGMLRWEAETLAGQPLWTDAEDE